MADWERESFEEILNDRLFSVTEAGPLSGPIKKFSLKRDEKLRLILETVSHASLIFDNLFQNKSKHYRLSLLTAPEGPGSSIFARIEQSG